MSEHWTQYDSEEAIIALKKILKDPEECIQLLEAAKKSSDFVDYIKKRISNEGGKLYDGHPIPSLDKMTENEFKNPPNDARTKIWENMQSMAPIDACRPGLWLHVTLDYIAQEKIESTYLAYPFNPKGQKTGQGNIDEAIRRKDEKGDQTKAPRYLECSRLILRRLFGAISDRGTKALFTDPPFARVWWQRYLAEAISQTGDGITPANMASFFAEASGVYAELTMRMCSSLTVIGDEKLRDGLMHFYFQAYSKKECPKGFDTNTDNFKLLIKRVGIMSAWRAMGALSVAENREEIYSCAKDIAGGALKND